MARQRRSLTNILGESGSSRDTISGLKTQNEHLKSENKELNAKIQAGDRRNSVFKILSNFVCFPSFAMYRNYG